MPGQFLTCAYQRLHGAKRIERRLVRLVRGFHCFAENFVQGGDDSGSVQ